MPRCTAAAPIAAAFLLLTACQAPPRQRAPERERFPILSSNGLSFNALTTNALLANGLSFNGLSFNGLTSNGLSFNGLSFNALTDETLRDDGRTEGEVAREVIAYMYSCAMPKGASEDLILDGEYYGTLTGSLGLAPEWGVDGGSCDATCQRWISACLLARTNLYGVPVKISVRGPHGALGVGVDEAAQFTLREGGFYGNLFSKESPTAYACSGPGSDVPALTARFCSSTDSGCFIQSVGDCVAANDRAYGACDGLDDDGAAINCRDDLDNPTETYAEVITVYLAEIEPTCGNAICEIGEREAGCADCTKADVFAFGSAEFHDGSSGIAFDSMGNIVIAGVYTGTTDLGTGPLEPYVSLKEFDEDFEMGFFLAKLDRSGDAIWSRSLEPPSPIGIGVFDAPTQIATDRFDNIILAGEIEEITNVTGRPLLAGPDGRSIWIARFGPNGEAHWSQSIDIETSGSQEVVTSLEISDAGNVYIGGYSRQCAGGSQCTYVAKLSPGGTVAWSRLFDRDTVAGISADAGDNLFVGGSYMTAGGQHGHYVEKLSPSGERIWRKQFRDEQPHVTPIYDGMMSLRLFHKSDRVAVGPDGSVVMSGYYAGTLDLGATVHDSGDADAQRFVLKLSADGDYLWSTTMSRNTAVTTVEVDRKGGIVMMGECKGDIDLGGGTIRCGNLLDGFVAKYNPDGDYLWSHRFGGPVWEIPTGMAVDDRGRVAVTGLFHATASLFGYYVNNRSGIFVLDWDDFCVPTFDFFIAAFDDPTFGQAIDTLQ